MQLRSRSEPELDGLLDDCLRQVGNDLLSTWRVNEDDAIEVEGKRRRMRQLLQDCGMMEETANPCVGRQAFHHAPDRVLSVVAEITGYSIAELKGDRRYSELARARHLLYLAMIESCRQLSGNRIAHLLNRDHTTIVHGLKRARKRVREDSYAAETYQRILSRLAWEK